MSRAWRSSVTIRSRRVASPRTAASDPGPSGADQAADVNRTTARESEDAASRGTTAGSVSSQTASVVRIGLTTYSWHTNRRGRTRRHADGRGCNGTHATRTPCVARMARLASRLKTEGAASKNVDGIVDDEPEETSVLRFTSQDGGERLLPHQFLKGPNRRQMSVGVLTRCARRSSSTHVS